MNLNKAKEKYIFYTEIDLGDGEFIRLREPNVAELDMITNAKDADRIATLGKLLPSCIIDHSFENDNGEKAEAGEVYRFIKESGSLFIEIVGKWFDSGPFKSRLRKEQTSET
jgi:hypothetical protein